ncbi:MAG: hypothetical protein KAT23_00995, partial [Anaerolineales bacterium]|nr:hypothetical protein [Anaerolineales bacterium]
MDEQQESSASVVQDVANGGEVWHTLEASKVVRALQTSPTRGLTTEQVARRVVEYGPNELVEPPRPTLWRMILEQFNNFIVIVLIVASIVSALLGDYIEAGAIMAIVLLNALLGVIQEHRAEEALAALQRLAAPEAHVIRDAHRQAV